jgi:hypothetical protein
MVPSYYRLQIDLYELIIEAMSQPLTYEETYEIDKKLDNILLYCETKLTSDLWDIGGDFSRWLVDLDIRLKDTLYHESTSNRLEEWCKSVENYYELPSKILNPRCRP